MPGGRRFSAASRAAISGPAARPTAPPRNAASATPISSATDGTRGGSYPSAGALVDVIESEWGESGSHRFVVLTGGEPLLQVDDGLLDALHDRGFAIAVETNGTIEPPSGLDWICVSPEGGNRAARPLRATSSSWFIRSRAHRRRHSPVLRSSASRCNRWTGRNLPTTPRAPSIIACGIRNGG